ncbi:MAG: hypothetical protein JWP27_1336 [Flaviaesturariibacter sp.]|nr:hypothetical protein [Flaviaesturariibacter sp.]
MRAALFLCLCSLLISRPGKSQGFTFSCARDTTVAGCAPTCITVNTLLPDMKGSTSSYTVNTIGTVGSCFTPPVAPDNTVGTSANLNTDDRYSAIINLGFNFSFFGTVYTRVIASPNGMISFDVTKAGQFAHFGLLNGGGFLNGVTGPPVNLPSTLYDKAIIMGPYHDLFPTSTTSPTKRIQYQVIGTAPYRRWVISYYKEPLFRNNCNTLIENTHQIVLYESTGIVEVFIYSKEICAAWNLGRAVVGMQDFTKTQAVIAPGRGPLDQPWGFPGMNESWRFTPSAGASLFKRAELYDLAGTLVSTGTAAPSGDGSLLASFPNVCITPGTSTFVVKSVYQKIDAPAVEIFGLDTIRVHEVPTTVSATVVSQPSLCGPPSGSLALSAPVGMAPLQYSINNGATFQAATVFSGLAPGAYSVLVRDAVSCTASLPATVALQNDLVVRTIADTSVCLLDSFTARTTITNAIGAASYSWTPDGGISATTAQSPVITAGPVPQYIVKATNGACTATDTLNLTILSLPLVDAGRDLSILEGDSVRLAAAASAGSYLWTPSLGLSSPTELNPYAHPPVTTPYLLQVTSPQGCSASDGMLLTVIPYCVRPMDAFTPNGDGQNDFWRATNGNCTVAVQAQVFNRYGSQVFATADYHNDWNGTFQGKALPDGAYYYILSYKLVNGRVATVRGNVTIIR